MNPIYSMATAGDRLDIYFPQLRNIYFPFLQIKRLKKKSKYATVVSHLNHVKVLKQSLARLKTSLGRSGYKPSSLWRIIILSIFSSKYNNIYIFMHQLWELWDRPDAFFFLLCQMSNVVVRDICSTWAKSSSLTTDHKKKTSLNLHDLQRKHYYVHLKLYIFGAFASIYSTIKVCFGLWR